MSQWWSCTYAMVNTEQDIPIYELGDTSNAVVYVGSSGSVKSRLNRHLAGDDRCISTHAAYYRVHYRRDHKAEEWRRYNAYVRAHGREPRCNDVAPPG